MIDSLLFECDWGTFSDCWLRVASAPPGAQAALFNVEAVHRRSPIAPEDQHLVCVTIEVNGVTRIYIDHCACFGCASSSGLFGCPGDAIIKIFSHKGVIDSLCWSDDFAFFYFPLVCPFLSHYPFQVYLPYSSLPPNPIHGPIRTMNLSFSALQQNSAGLGHQISIFLLPSVFPTLNLSGTSRSKQYPFPSKNAQNIYLDSNPGSRAPQFP